MGIAMTQKVTLKYIVLLVILLLMVGSIVYWSGLSTKSTIRNVLLISIDTCRADRLSSYGYERQTTPNIDVLAQTAILFKNANSPVPLTLPAHSSALTGTYPPYHKVHDNLHTKLDKNQITLAEILSENGYSTGAVVSSVVLNRAFGTAQGFASYNDKFEMPINKQLERRGEEASHFAGQFLEDNQDNSFFLFLHYYDPHMEYNPPEPYASEYADDLYAGEIAYTDHCIGGVIEQLKSLDLYDNTLIIIMGDHGESLGEHGETEHGYFIYQSTTWVPLIIRPPHLKSTKEITEVVSLVDIVPTILSYLDIEIPDHIQGQDLSSYGNKRSSPPSRDYIYTESLTPTKFECNPLLGIIDKKWSLIQTTHPELYDLENDRKESDNLYEKNKQRARLMQTNLQDLVVKLVNQDLTSNSVNLDEETQKQLASLGYVGGDAVNDSLEFNPEGKDPKELIAYYEQRQKVNIFIRDKKFSEARGLCSEMLNDWPDVPNTLFLLTRIAYDDLKWEKVMTHGRDYLNQINQIQKSDAENTVIDNNKPIAKTHELIAKAAFKLDRFDVAIQHGNQALDAANSPWPEIYVTLAASYFSQNNFEQAIEHWTKVLEIKPDFAETHHNLAGAYYKNKNFNKAIEHWNLTLKLNANFPDARQNLIQLHDQLAQAFYAQNNIASAIQHWQEALLLNPNHSDIHNKIGTAYYKQNQTALALNHWRKALQFKPDQPDILNNMAWILATTDLEPLRNTAEAVTLAQKAVQLTQKQNPGILDTLSVTYAANGQFTKAITTVELALKLALDQDNTELTESIRQHLTLFKAGKTVK